MNSFSIIFDIQFREDIGWWFRKRCDPASTKGARERASRQDKKIGNRILDLVESVITDPFSGIGKPEHLKYLPGSLWSRRITQEHRLVYQVSSDKIIFLQARYHYQK